MAEIQVYLDKYLLAGATALKTAELLKDAINDNGHAVWILAGGSTPALAYERIVKDFGAFLDWQKVYFLIGDERTVLINDELSNYKAIKRDLLDKLDIDQSKVVIPNYSQNNKKDAEEYSDKVRALLANFNDRIDVLWLGIGEDGHTLSLFPGNQAINNVEDYVIPVENSPKPPSARISLGLRALRNVDNAIVLVSGDGKKKIFKEIKAGKELPINIVVKHLEQYGTRVEWLVSSEADS
jgi:6-phosphogluconolactonase